MKAAPVVLGGLDADLQRTGHLLVGQAFHHQLHDLALARGQGIEAEGLLVTPGDVGQQRPEISTDTVGSR